MIKTHISIRIIKRLTKVGIFINLFTPAQIFDFIFFIIRCYRKFKTKNTNQIRIKTLIIMQIWHFLLLLPWVSLLRPAPFEPPQGGNAARVKGCSGAIKGACPFFCLIFLYSGCSVARYRASMGCWRSSVQIRPSRLKH